MTDPCAFVELFSDIGCSECHCDLHAAQAWYTCVPKTCESGDSDTFDVCGACYEESVKACPEHAHICVKQNGVPDRRWIAVYRFSRNQVDVVRIGSPRCVLKPTAAELEWCQCLSMVRGWGQRQWEPYSYFEPYGAAFEDLHEWVPLMDWLALGHQGWEHRVFAVMKSLGDDVDGCAVAIVWFNWGLDENDMAVLNFGGRIMHASVSEYRKASNACDGVQKYLRDVYVSMLDKFAVCGCPPLPQEQC